MKKKILYTALVLLSVIAILAPLAMLMLETVKLEPLVNCANAIAETPQAFAVR